MMMSAVVSTQVQVETPPTTTTIQRRHRHRRRQRQTRRRSKRVGVTFCEMVKVLEVEKLEDCCCDGDNYKHSDCFYTKSDYARIRSDIKQSLHIMNMKSSSSTSDESSDDDLDLDDLENHTKRGLEVRTPEGSKQRRQNKEAAWEALFDEQDKQWHNGIHHPDLATVYSKETKRCSIEALLRGLQDHSVVTRIMMNEDHRGIISDENNNNNNMMPLLQLGVGVSSSSSSSLKETTTTTSCFGDVEDVLHRPNSLCSPLQRDDNTNNFVCISRRKSITAFAA